jgi:glutamyl-tRNA synthetase
MGAGRYAPSPTGTLHLGNLRTAVAACLSARSRSNRFLLRIEDLDGPRCRPEFVVRQLDDLAALGIRWDEEPLRQSDRAPVYTEHFQRLVDRRLVYPCFCSRKEIQEALSAPHGPAASAYPGTCAAIPWPEAQRRIDAGEQHGWRLRVQQAPKSFLDGFAGEVPLDLARDGGDFIVRRADGLLAYHFACAVDDALSGVSEVLRGADLLDSGLRQAHLLACLGLPVPRYCHIPLMLGPDGRRLAKRVGSEDLTGLLSRGHDLTAIASYLVYTLGAAGRGERLTLEQAVPRWDLARVPRHDIVFDEAELRHFAP